jgi:membrane protein involved in colicin uptake
MNSKLDRTAVKNAKKAQKRKEEKAASDALQAERLRKHQKQLEKTKINEFYSTGAGKNTPWGTKGSSKRPQATASVNEHGSLIWD